MRACTAAADLVAPARSGAADEPSLRLDDQVAAESDRYVAGQLGFFVQQLLERCGRPPVDPVEPAFPVGRPSPTSVGEDCRQLKCGGNRVVEPEPARVARRVLGEEPDCELRTTGHWALGGDFSGVSDHQAGVEISGVGAPPGQGFVIESPALDD